MSIPKVIHYCWFGHNPLSAKELHCIESWKRLCPDYQIIEWNESNFDIHANLYARQAYAAQKWAFVSDYARLKIIYEHGGIYLDTDVELLRPLDSLLETEGFMGFQQDARIATGLGFGACPKHPLVHAMLEDYDSIPFFKEDGSMDTTPCPNRNTLPLLKLGLEQRIDSIQKINNFYFFPPEYFSPKDYYTNMLRTTANTYSIHHYASSWVSPETKAYVAHLHRMATLEKIIGPKLFSKIKYLWHRLHGKPQ